MILRTKLWSHERWHEFFSASAAACSPTSLSSETGITCQSKCSTSLQCMLLFTAFQPMEAPRLSFAGCTVSTQTVCHTGHVLQCCSRPSDLPTSPLWFVRGHKLMLRQACYNSLGTPTHTWTAVPLQYLGTLMPYEAASAAWLGTTAYHSWLSSAAKSAAFRSEAFCSSQERAYKCTRAKRKPAPARDQQHQALPTWQLCDAA